MAALPVSYMREIRRITGYYGAHPLAQNLAPGMVGRRVGGAFIRDADLPESPKPGDDTYATRVEPARNPSDSWHSEKVTVNAGGLAIGGAALPADANISVRFSNADE